MTTDLYQLTMAAAYVAGGVEQRAFFELFVRKMPTNRGYLIAAGLEQALEYLSALRFDADDLDFLRSLPMFQDAPAGFFEELAGLRFTGNVSAPPEGTVIFANEPLLRVEASIIEAQLAETYLLSTMLFQTMIASKAARVVDAASGRPVVDFGTRRAHGPEAGVLAARAAYLGGCAGTSNVEAGRRFGVPVFGTMAHSFILASGSEKEAFERFMRAFPDNASLLVDTYNIRAGVEMALNMGDGVKSVRIDSGDLARESRSVRKQLNGAGRDDIQIIASGDLNECRIQKLIQNDAPIDIFGVGTEMTTSRDEPSLSGVYKLISYERGGKIVPAAKTSAGKRTYPYPKQVFRQSGPDGFFMRDIIALHDETHEGEPLLEKVMEKGERIHTPPPLKSARNRAAEQLERLPCRYKCLQNAAEYPARFSPKAEKARKKAASARLNGFD